MTIAALFVVAVALVGLGLTRAGVHLHERSLFVLTGRWAWHLSAWALPAVAVAALTVGYATPLAERLRFGVLLAVAVGWSALWAVAVALVGGPGAIGAPLAAEPEYLHDVPRVHAGFLREFTAHIVGPGSWTTHVAGHPPLMIAMFAGLAAAGLGGSGWAAALVIAVGATAVASVLSTTRLLAGETTARRAAPFVAVSPLALWIATSADAFFAGVAAAALCGLAHANARRGPRAVALAAVAGVLFGACAFLSYGLVLLAVPALALALYQRRVLPLLVAAAGVLVVVAGFAVAGFWWLAGFRAARVRVMAGDGYVDRPAAYFWFADPATVALSVGPAVVAATALIRRPFAGLRPDPARTRADGFMVMPFAAAAVIVLAIVSNLAKGEVERIYLPFTVWFLPLAAALPAPRTRWLAAQCLLTLLIALTTTLSW